MFKFGVIGRAFTGTKGRLFPVMTDKYGLQIKANFGEQEFAYKGL